MTDACACEAYYLPQLKNLHRSSKRCRERSRDLDAETEEVLHASHHNCCMPDPINLWHERSNSSINTFMKLPKWWFCMLLKVAVMNWRQSRSKKMYILEGKWLVLQLTCVAFSFLPCSSHLLSKQHWRQLTCHALAQIIHMQLHCVLHVVQVVWKVQENRNCWC